MLHCILCRYPAVTGWSLVTDAFTGNLYFCRQLPNSSNCALSSVITILAESLTGLIQNLQLFKFSVFFLLLKINCYRKYKLLDAQIFLFLIVFSILRKTPNATYIFSIHYLSFYHCWSLLILLAATSNNDIFYVMYMLFMLNWKMMWPLHRFVLYFLLLLNVETICEHRVLTACTRLEWQKLMCF